MKIFDKIMFLTATSIWTIGTIFGIIPYLFGGDTSLYGIISTLIFAIGLPFLLMRWYREIKNRNIKNKK